MFTLDWAHVIGSCGPALRPFPTDASGCQTCNGWHPGLIPPQGGGRWRVASTAQPGIQVSVPLYELLVPDGVFSMHFFPSYPSCRVGRMAFISLVSKLRGSGLPRALSLWVMPGSLIPNLQCCRTWCPSLAFKLASQLACCLSPAGTMHLRKL